MAKLLISPLNKGLGVIVAAIASINIYACAMQTKKQAKKLYSSLFIFIRLPLPYPLDANSTLIRD
jgi:hypothetical protein